MSLPTVDVRKFVDKRPLSRLQILVIALCFLVVATDGFDTADIGYIAPALKVEWSLKPQQLAPALPQVFGLMTTAFFWAPRG